MCVPDGGLLAKVRRFGAVSTGFLEEVLGVLLTCCGLLPEGTVLFPGYAR